MILLIQLMLFEMLRGSLGTVAGINTAFLAGGVVVVLVSAFALLRAPALREALATVQARVVARSG